MGRRRRRFPAPKPGVLYIVDSVEGENELPVDPSIPYVELTPAGNLPPAPGRPLYIVGEPVVLENELPVDPSIPYLEFVYPARPADADVPPPPPVDRT